LVETNAPIQGIRASSMIIQDTGIGGESASKSALHDIAAPADGVCYDYLGK